MKSDRIWSIVIPITKRGSPSLTVTASAGLVLQEFGLSEKNAASNKMEKSPINYQFKICPRLNKQSKLQQGKLRRLLQCLRSPRLDFLLE